MGGVHAAQVKGLVAPNALNGHGSSRWALTSTAFATSVGRTVEVVRIGPLDVDDDKFRVKVFEATAVKEPPAFRASALSDHRGIPGLAGFSFAGGDVADCALAPDRALVTFRKVCRTDLVAPWVEGSLALALAGVEVAAARVVASVARLEPNRLRLGIHRLSGGGR